MGEVLTLAEAAAYLRVVEPEVVRMVHEQGLAGRQVGSEWRFSRDAIQEWLRTGPGTMTLEQNKAAWQSVAGKYRDDPDLQRICDEAYRERGRSPAGKE